MDERPPFPAKLPLRKTLYLQVRDVLTERIASGTWKPGESIANENDLARELGVSSGTVRKALELMETQRVIRRRTGRGTFVNDQTDNELAARFCSLRGPDGSRVCGRVVSVNVTEGVATGEEHRRLGLPANDPVYRVCRVRALDEQAFLFEEATVPGVLFPDLAARGEVAATVTALAREYGVLLGTAEERISLAEPTPAGAQALGIAAGSTVMRRERVVFILNGPPAEWAVAQCHLAGGCYLAEIR